MMNEVVISVSQYIKWGSISDVLKRERFEYIPAVAYTVQREGPKAEENLIHYFPKPFCLLEPSLPIEILCKYAKDEFKSRDELKVARKAYLKLRNFANRSAERVLADLTATVLLKTLNSEDQFIYFFEGPPTDKVLSRLGYLYLSLKNITVCFISFKPEDLITSVMSFNLGQLQFDFNRAFSEEITGFQGPYPGDSEESLIQTYFYSPPKGLSSKKPSPIRIDIFSQGLLISDFENKKEIIRKKLEDENWTAPYSIDDKNNIFTILPKSLIEVIKSWKIIYNKQLEDIIKKRRTDIK